LVLKLLVLTLEPDENSYLWFRFCTAETDDLTYFRCKGIEDDGNYK
jgi:hypothetical protein